MIPQKAELNSPFWTPTFWPGIIHLAKPIIGCSLNCEVGHHYGHLATYIGRNNIVDERLSEVVC